MGGVNIKGKCFIGSHVVIDTMRPDLITIGEGATITTGTSILTHFYRSSTSGYYYGEVEIGDNVFLGMNTLIVKPMKIGDGSVVGAGSVLTKDIPAGEIWAGNPAKFIRKIK